MPKKQKNLPTAKAPAAPTPAHDLEDFRAAKREWSSRFLLQRRPMPASRALMAPVTPDPAWNIQGVGIGEKLMDGRRTGVMAVKFLVRRKYHESHISKKHSLPKSISGLPTDVDEVGLFRCFPALLGTAATVSNPRTRVRPAQPGCSVGFADPDSQFVMAGTFGALVKYGSGIYILSNNHVLADEGQLPAGAPIFQPGLLDGGNPKTDQIAQLTKFVPLQPGVANQVDCAIAAVASPGDVSNAILQIGPPQGAGDAQIDMPVQKYGRTTNYTAGQITSIDTDVTVQYEMGSLMFAGQIIVAGSDGQPFSAAGDSGSLVVERGSNMAVGLLFAGSESTTIANHINDVMRALNISLA